MEDRQPLTPDHNAVASKDKRLSPPSADPEGGAQDARRFPIERAANKTGNDLSPSRRRAPGTARSRFGKRAHPVAAKKSNSPTAKAFQATAKEQSHWIPAYAGMTNGRKTRSGEEAIAEPRVLTDIDNATIGR
jgi:hypothetical protein